MNHPLVFINGKKIENPTTSLPFSKYATSHIFETMLIREGEVFQLEMHVERLFESAKTIGLVPEKSREDICEEIKNIVQNVGARRAVPRLIRYSITEHERVAIIFERVYPESVYEKGIDLKTAVTRKNHINAHPPEAKVGDFLNNILGKSDHLAESPFEVLFLDSYGYLNEGSVSNFFIVKEGILITPPSWGILNGVTRRFVIECAAKEKIQVKEDCFTRHDVFNAEESFITNTSGGIVPVRSLDGRLIAKGKVPGPVTKKLCSRLNAL